jgi:phosphatidylglycerophosphate synthase
MIAAARNRAVRLGGLAVGLAAFGGALYYADAGTILDVVRRLGPALPLALLISGLWHLTRTWAWAACFPQPRPVGFLRLVRLRLSAEAFSYLTFGWMAGEPLKIVLLSESLDARQATAAVALERLAYLVGTTTLIAIGAALALIGLPLTRVWSQIFTLMAIGGAAVTTATVLMVLDGPYAEPLLRRIDRAFGTALAETRIARFATSIELQTLDLIRSRPRRLLVPVGATVASYVLMALEAWVILRACGAPVPLTSAFAAETITRVASFASAFVPANLGTLEASNVAAAAAVGAVGAGTGLALARRLRGLFWAGVGLAIYPRGLGDRNVVNESGQGRGPTLVYLPQDPAVPVSWSAKLAGLPVAERVVRAAARAGYTRIVLWVPDALCPPRFSRWLRLVGYDLGSHVDVATVQRDWESVIESLDSNDTVTIVGAGTVVSPALLAKARDLSVGPGESIDVAAGPNWPESGVIRMTAADAHDREQVVKELAARRLRSLPLPSGVEVSKGQAMLALRILHPTDLPVAEETIRRASYKETDAKIARFNRRISLPISVNLIPTPLTANQLSVLLVAIGFYSAWLFSAGHYWTGLVAAFLSLAASILDGCDGEIARLKYQESALGCWIETFGDYSYYLAIFVGLTIGAVRQTHWAPFYWVGTIALAGTLLSFGILIFLRSRITGGRPEKLHALARARFKSEPTFWSRIVWRMSFVATRAAMPYGIMAFSLLHALPFIVVLAAIGANVYWISLVMKMRHLLGSADAVATA